MGEMKRLWWLQVAIHCLAVSASPPLAKRQAQTLTNTDTISNSNMGLSTNTGTTTGTGTSTNTETSTGTGTATKTGTVTGTATGTLAATGTANAPAIGSTGADATTTGPSTNPPSLAYTVISELVYTTTSHYVEAIGLQGDTKSGAGTAGGGAVVTGVTAIQYTTKDQVFTVTTKGLTVDLENGQPVLNATATKYQARKDLNNPATGNSLPNSGGATTNGGPSKCQIQARGFTLFYWGSATTPFPITQTILNIDRTQVVQTATAVVTASPSSDGGEAIGPTMGTSSPPSSAAGSTGPPPVSTQYPSGYSTMPTAGLQSTLILSWPVRSPTTTVTFTYPSVYMYFEGLATDNGAASVAKLLVSVQPSELSSMRRAVPSAFKVDALTTASGEAYVAAVATLASATSLAAVAVQTTDILRPGLAAFYLNPNAPTGLCGPTSKGPECGKILPAMHTPVYSAPQAILNAHTEWKACDAGMWPAATGGYASQELTRLSYSLTQITKSTLRTETTTTTATSTYSKPRIVVQTTTIVFEDSNGNPERTITQVRTLLNKGVGNPGSLTISSDDGEETAFVTGQTALGQVASIGVPEMTGQSNTVAVAGNALGSGNTVAAAGDNPLANALANLMAAQAKTSAAAPPTSSSPPPPSPTSTPFTVIKRPVGNPPATTQAAPTPSLPRTTVPVSTAASSKPAAVSQGVAASVMQNALSSSTTSQQVATRLTSLPRVEQGTAPTTERPVVLPTVSTSQGRGSGPGTALALLDTEGSTEAAEVKAAAEPSTPVISSTPVQAPRLGASFSVGTQGFTAIQVKPVVEGSGSNSNPPANIISIANTVLTAGGAGATLSGGQRISAQSDGAILANGHTVVRAAPTPSPVVTAPKQSVAGGASSAYLTIGTQTLTAVKSNDASSHPIIVLGSKTLTANQVLTTAGQVIALNGAGGLQIGSSSVMFGAAGASLSLPSVANSTMKYTSTGAGLSKSSSTSTDNPYVTIGSATFSTLQLSNGGLVIGTQTLSQGGTAVLASQTVILASNGIQMALTTLPLAMPFMTGTATGALPTQTGESPSSAGSPALTRNIPLVATVASMAVACLVGAILL